MRIIPRPAIARDHIRSREDEDDIDEVEAPFVVALVAGKGGVGKSTTAVTLCGELVARTNGRHVLLVDADPQESSTDWFNDAAAGQRLLDRDGNPSLPGHVRLGAYMHQPGQLDMHSRGRRWVLIDCPGNGKNTEITRSALAAADLAILPFVPGPFEARELDEFVKMLKEAQGRYPQLRVAALINRKKPGTVLGRAAREVVASTGLEVLQTELHDRIAFPEMVAAGTSMSRYAPRSPAAAEAAALTTELFGADHEERETRAEGRKVARRLVAASRHRLVG